MLQGCSIVTFVFLLTSSLAGQTPVGRSAGLDLGALATDELRLGVEPMVVGRWSLHLGLARWSDNQTPAPSAFGRQAREVGLEAVPGNTELALDVTLRTYPAALSSAVPTHRFRAYLGVGGGVRQRTRARYEPVSCRFCEPSGLTIDRRRGVDPLAEVGVRFEPAAHVLLDVGLRTRLVAFGDPTGRFATGDIDPHVNVGVGFRW